MTKTTISTPSARVLLTSDHHFGHEAVLRLSSRPFASIGEHDEYLVEAWNASVGPKDEVWHLGDFAYKCTAEHAAQVFSPAQRRQAARARQPREARQGVAVGVAARGLRRYRH